MDLTVCSGTCSIKPNGSMWYTFCSYLLKELSTLKDKPGKNKEDLRYGDFATLALPNLPWKVIRVMLRNKIAIPRFCSYKPTYLKMLFINCLLLSNLILF